MLERSTMLFKALCAGLAVLILCQLLFFITHSRPWMKWKIPNIQPPSGALEYGNNKRRADIMPSENVHTPGADNLPAGPPASVSIHTNASAMTVKSGPPRMNPGAPNQPSDLPPALKARIDRIIQSEIFGMIPKPLPMALLGIAGQDVMLRAPNGQTGLLQEGGELGGIKLLRIGANRILVEEKGVQKELTIFSGLGGESLLPKGKENIP